MRLFVGIAATLSAVAFRAPVVTAQGCAPTQLTAPGGNANDRFGTSIAVTTDTIVVGAEGRTVGPNSFQGQAFVYRWNGSAWNFEAALTASDGAQGDSFGHSVAISGDTAVIGAYAKTVSGASSQGVAYVFTRSGTVWTQQAKLVGADGAAGDSFGYSVAIVANTAVCGAYAKNAGPNQFQGAAYVFTRSGTVWTQQAKLLASDGGTNDFFGTSISLTTDTIAIGANGATVSAKAAQGAVYVFVRSGIIWTQQAKLIASDGLASDYLGASVGISNNTIVAGALYKAVGPNPFQGAAYIFTRAGTVWSQQAKLVASDGAPFDYFGNAAVVAGDTAIFGAYNQTVGANANQGVAYAFQRSGTTWTQQSKLLSADGAPGDAFGTSVAIAGSTAVAGAPQKMIAAKASQGAAYAFGSNVPISLIQQPVSASVCSVTSAVFSVTALGTGPFSYSWQWRAGPSVPQWTAVAEGSNSAGARTFAALNSHSPSITVSSYHQTDAAGPFGDFRCIVSNACGGTTSNPASAKVCWGDFNCDGQVEDTDFVIFASAYNLLDCDAPAMPAGCPADLISNGVVDDADFALFANAYNILVCP